MTRSHAPWPADHLDTTIAANMMRERQQGIFLSLPYVAQLFALSPFEVQTLVVCLAPELRRKYDTLYAYLQDDVDPQKAQRRSHPGSPLHLRS